MLLKLSHICPVNDAGVEADSLQAVLLARQKSEFIMMCKKCLLFKLVNM